MASHNLVSCVGTALIAVVLLAGSAAPARAASFDLETVVGANLGCNPAGPYQPATGGCLNFEDPLDFQIFSTGFLNISSTYTLQNGDTMIGSATADVAFGRLKARASAQYNLTSPETAAVFANAFTRDELTIDAPDVANGTAMTLDFHYRLDGTISGNGPNILAGVQVGVFATGLSEDVFQLYTTTQVNTLHTVSIPYQDGVAFELGMLLGAGAGTFDLCSAVPSCPPEDSLVWPAPRTGAGSASVDFFNTMEITGMIPKLNGVAITNAAFSSASNTQYSVEGVVPVPEPGSLLLLGTGLGLGIRRWHRRVR